MNVLEQMRVVLAEDHPWDSTYLGHLDLACALIAELSGDLMQALLDRPQDAPPDEVQSVTAYYAESQCLLRHLQQRRRQVAAAVSRPIMRRMTL